MAPPFSMSRLWHHVSIPVDVDGFVIPSPTWQPRFVHVILHFLSLHLTRSSFLSLSLSLSSHHLPSPSSPSPSPMGCCSTSFRVFLENFHRPKFIPEPTNLFIHILQEQSFFDEKVTYFSHDIAHYVPLLF